MDKQLKEIVDSAINTICKNNLIDIDDFRYIGSCEFYDAILSNKYIGVGGMALPIPLRHFAKRLENNVADVASVIQAIEVISPDGKVSIVKNLVVYSDCLPGRSIAYYWVLIKFRKVL